MQIRNYNNELRSAQILFAGIFRNMRITRSLDGENQKRTTIDVPVVLSSRSRIFKNLENLLAQSVLTLPLVTVERTGIQIDNNRITNLHNEIKNQEQEGRVNYNLYTPVPISLTFKVCFVSRYLTDIDMMLGQVLPFFNSDIYVSSRHPKYKNVQYSSQIVLGNSIDIEANPEISKDQDEIHTATLTFTFKTYIFGGTEQKELGPINPYIAPITKIDAEIHTVPYLEPDYNDVGKGTGIIGTSQDLSKVKEASIDNYFKKLDAGEIPFPEYEMLDWILDYQYDQNGNLIYNDDGSAKPLIDMTQPYGYEPERGDGLTQVTTKNRLYDQEVETNHDNVKLIQSENYYSQWGMPWREIETRPWSDLDGQIYDPTDEDLKERNPMGSEDYTNY